MQKIKHIAIIGVQGIPARYGGFETLAENLVRWKSDGQTEYTVFCSSRDLSAHPKEYLGAKLKFIPLLGNGIQSILYDIVSMIRCIRGYDCLLILGVSGCVFIPVLQLLTQGRIIVNIDGLEHRRAKWNRIARWFLKLSEKMAVKYADVIIADNDGIREYVRETYNRETVMIAYGGDHALVDVTEERQAEILSGFGLSRGGYALTICRIEPENNVDVILCAFSRSEVEIAVVGNFEKNDHSRKLKEEYKANKNIHFIDACYDLKVLFALRRNASCYVHGHSAGGTNPSLVEAMHFGIPIICYDVNYNRITTNGEAEYFTGADDLLSLIGRSRRASGFALKEYATGHYTWKAIVSAYERIYAGYK